MSFFIAHQASSNSGRPPVALVTGAARNLGLAIALALSEAGFAIVAATHEGDGLSPRADGPVLVSREDAHSLGLVHNWDVVSCDLATAEDCGQLIAFIRDRYERLDCLVNNAATWVWSGVETSDEQWRQLLEVNVLAPARLVREAYTLLAHAPCGRVVNIGSISGFFSERQQTAYSTSKAALHGLTRSLAIELASDAITVNAVAPGLMRTSTNTAGALSHSDVPLGMLGSPDDVGQLVAFLASEAAGYITGAVIPCDGGAMAAGFFAAQTRGLGS